MRSDGTAGRDSDDRWDKGSPSASDGGWVGDHLQGDSTEGAQSLPPTVAGSSAPDVPDAVRGEAASEPPAVIDSRYQLLRRIGHGGMGEVWEALDTRLNRKVAVKGLLDRGAMGAATQAQLMKRARREAEAIARIKHQNVVAVHDRVETDSQVWIVMELLDAHSLADLLRAEQQLTVRRTARIGLQVLRGLRAVHDAGVVHRDVKPHNVLFRPNEFAILTDFGIATFDGAVPVTRSGELVGTMKYLAPELFDRLSGQSRAATPASDLWALGITLYEMVEGRTPFDGLSPVEFLISVCESPLPRMRYAGPLVPVVEELLRKDPQQRLSAAEAEEMLRAIVQESQTPDAPSQNSASVRPPDPVSAPPAHPVQPAQPSAPPSAPSSAPPSVPPSAVVPAPKGRGRGRQKVSAAALCVALLAGLGWYAVDRFQRGDETNANAGPGKGAEAEKYRETHKTLKIGVKADQPGLGEKPGKKPYRGYEIDMAYTIAEDMGYGRDEVEFKPVSTENRSSLLESGAVDLVIATYSITDKRKHAKPPEYSVAFAGPYYVANRSFLVSTKTKLHKVEDSSDLIRDNLEVCTARGSTYVDWLAEEKFNMTKSRPNGYEGCVQRLLSPASDVYAVSTDDVIVAGFVKNNPTQLKRLPSGPGAEGYGVAMKPEAKGLKAEVCSALRKIMTDGQWERLYKEHLYPLMDKAGAPNKPDLTECPKSG
ncbi:serine/threonine-protein kinase [Streptomyces sp. NPDC048473]|uniref:serine/threonine-protein kinase n=1 Tax=unclassified Streptomyces TaxID=2593676 RepID=UPI00371B8896